jgi:hypothetical protein
MNLAPKRRWPRFSLQFGTSGLMLAVTFVCICLASFLGAWGQLAEFQRHTLLWELLWLSPFWFPVVFVAYAAGRREITVKFVLAFAIAQLIAIGGLFAIPSVYQWWWQ